MALPGIGPYTAGAISTFAFGHPNVFIETNIRRVFIHFFFQGEEKVRDREIMELVEMTLDRRDPIRWYYSLMDYGAMLKRAESGRSGGGNGERNPNRRSAHYRKQAPFQGSDRQIRGGILRELLGEGNMNEGELASMIGMENEEGVERVRYILDQLVREGMVKESRGRYAIEGDR